MRIPQWLMVLRPIKEPQWNEKVTRRSYHEIAQETTSLEEDPEILTENKIGHVERPWLTRIVLAFSLLFKLAFVISWFWLSFYAWRHRKSMACVLGNERIFDDLPIIYETRRFQRAGFHDGRHSALTLYEGPPNAQNNAAWRELLAVGVVAISNQENAKITNGTASMRQDKNTHIVELEMFHQLHCLSWLRDRYWELEDAYDGINTRNLDSIPQRKDHADHCIDYLRQVIMCHGDVTPITFEWNDEISGYIAHHSTEHKCRSFDVIYEWTKRRDKTGLVVDGNHKNVELTQHEIFD